jgi:hypothetical protein
MRIGVITIPETPTIPRITQRAVKFVTLDGCKGIKSLSIISKVVNGGIFIPVSLAL